MKASRLQDIEAHRVTEIDAITGAIADLAATRAATAPRQPGDERAAARARTRLADCAFGRVSSRMALVVGAVSRSKSVAVEQLLWLPVCLSENRDQHT